MSSFLETTSLNNRLWRSWGSPAHILTTASPNGRGNFVRGDPLKNPYHIRSIYPYGLRFGATKEVSIAILTTVLSQSMLLNGLKLLFASAQRYCSNVAPSPTTSKMFAVPILSFRGQSVRGTLTSFWFSRRFDLNRAGACDQRLQGMPCLVPVAILRIQEGGASRLHPEQSFHRDRWHKPAHSAVTVKTCHLLEEVAIVDGPTVMA